MGLSNSETKRWVYVDVKDGAFFVGKDDNQAKYDSIDGVLLELTHLQKDSEKYGVKQHLRVALADLDGTVNYSIQVGLETVFGRMFAGYLAADEIKQSDHIRLRANPLDGNPKVTTCHVELNDGGQWTRATYTKVDDSVALQIIESHSAYKVYVAKEKKPATGQGNAFARGSAEELKFIALITEAGWPDFAPNEAVYERWFGAIMTPKTDRWPAADTNPATWLFFADCASKNIAVQKVPKVIAENAAKAYDPFAEDEEPTTAPQADPVVEQKPVPVVTGSANAHLTGEPVTPSVQTSALVPGPTVPPDKSAFGWIPLRWVVPGQVSREGTDQQKGFLSAEAERLGLSVEEMHQCRIGVWLELGGEGKQSGTMAAYQLCIDFLKAMDTAVALEAVAKGSVYDPFSGE